MMTAASSERLERLTNLASSAFGRSCKVSVLEDLCVEVVDDSEWLLASIATHPRALDALEAALLVLAGKAPLVAAGQGAVCQLAAGPTEPDETGGA